MIDEIKNNLNYYHYYYYYIHPIQILINHLVVSYHLQYNIKI